MTKREKEKFMREALREGRKALPRCRPNPPVGCVIVKNGEIISRGHTNRPGEDHAEARALKLLPKDFDFEGVSMFVTLEPCSFFGRTPSCAKNIVRLKVPKVYVAILDPHPRNRGAGIDILKNAGVEVEVGILEEEIMTDLQPFLTVA